MMNKQADMNLMRLALLSMLGGGGVYGGMRLGKDLNTAATPYEAPGHELQVTLPSSRIPQKTAQVEKQSLDALPDVVAPALTIGGGLAGGFLGTAKLYDLMRRKQINDQMQNVEGDYMQALQKAHQKIAQVQTPLLDKLCEGLVSKIGEQMKTANITDAGIVNPADSGQLVHDTVVPPLHNFWEMFKGGNMLAALAAAGATYGIGKRMDAQKESNKQQTTLPTEVKLNVA